MHKICQNFIHPPKNDINKILLLYDDWLLEQHRSIEEKIGILPEIG